MYPVPSPELESPVGQIAHGPDIPGNRRRLVETGVEHERPQAECARCRGRGHQRREGCRCPEVVGYVQHVETQFLRPSRGVVNLRPRPRVV